MGGKKRTHRKAPLPGKQKKNIIRVGEWQTLQREKENCWRKQMPNRALSPRWGRNGDDLRSRDFSPRQGGLALFGSPVVKKSPIVRRAGALRVQNTKNQGAVGMARILYQVAPERVGGLRKTQKKRRRTLDFSPPKTREMRSQPPTSSKNSIQKGEKGSTTLL